jgi:hypothetical protein
MMAGEAEGWDPHRAVRDLVQKTPELCDLYHGLGYSPYLEWRCRELLAQLNDLEVVIPDFAVFESSLNSAIAAVERHERGEAPLTLADALCHYDRYDRELFESVVTARASRDAVLQLLNADFRKRLPSSVEASAISRRPRNPDTFAGVLRELDQLFREPWLPQTQDVREELLEAVSELREELERGENPSVVTILESVERRIEDAVFNIADKRQDEKRRSLDGVLWSFVYVRHEYRPHAPYFIEGVTEEAKTYIRSAWMHTEWLTTFMLLHLLDGEVASRVPARLSEKGLLVSTVAIVVLFYLNLLLSGLSVLAALSYYVGNAIWQTHKTRPLVSCRQEIASGTYDGHEVGRRLRDLESRGVFVHSLILRLLELHGR